MDVKKILMFIVAENNGSVTRHVLTVQIPPPPQQQLLGHGQQLCEISFPSKLPLER